MGYSHSHSHSDLGGFCQTILRVRLSSSPTKLCVRPESMIVDTLGGITMIDTINKYGRIHYDTTIREVKIVLFDKDIKSIQVNIV
jgi:hypothetical protein